VKCLRIFLLVCCLFLRTGYAQEEYSFDLSEIEKKAFQFGGYLEARPVFSLLDQDSYFYLLRFYDSSVSRTSSEYNFKALLDLSFEKGIAKAQMRLNTDLSYFDTDWSHKTILYEGYLSLRPSLHFQIGIGKKRLKWGKGYAWNPVAFIDNPKNPYDPDLALEGFTVFSADYIKSFSGKLKTLTITAVLLPIFEHINSKAGSLNTLNFGGKFYFLLFDTDIDMLFLSGPGVSSRYGIDFSRNIASNFEIHGEWAYINSYPKRILDEAGISYDEEKAGSSYLLGIRFLTKTNTTFFLEYYRNGKGYTQGEMENYYGAIERAYEMFLETGDENDLQMASSLSDYRTFTPARNYLYLRISQKEPFNILYFTPSITSICNLKDRSFSLAPELLYAPVTNLELRAKAMFLLGKKGTEFREKQNDFRLELRFRYYF
jgi:hypothetical protein